MSEHEKVDVADLAPVRSELNLDQLVTRISLWGMRRGISINGTLSAQTVKLMEEVGELAAAVARGQKYNLGDAIGDCFVVLVMLADIAKLDIHTCIAGAYDEIKDRKGYLTPEGIFVKEPQTVTQAV